MSHGTSNAELETQHSILLNNKVLKYVEQQHPVVGEVAKSYRALLDRYGTA
jgi:hypothetical protein